MFFQRDGQTNFAREDGISHKELPAAIIFTALYVPLLCLCVYRSIRSTYVYKFLSMFCLLRVVAFAMRAALSGSSTAGNDINVVVAELIIYNIGFSGLLYSAYGLVLDRYLVSSTAKHEGFGPLAFVMDLLRTRMLIRAILTAAIILGIIGGIDQSDGVNDPHKAHEGNTLRKISIYLFLVVVCFFILVTGNLVFNERNSFSRWDTRAPSLGQRHGTPILLIIALMFITREAYLVATIGNVAKQNKPELWYPLVATTELISVLLLMVPGLVPSQEEVTDFGEEQTSGNTNPLVRLTRV